MSEIVPSPQEHKGAQLVAASGGYALVAQENGDVGIGVGINKKLIERAGGMYKPGTGLAIAAGNVAIDVTIGAAGALGGDSGLAWLGGSYAAVAALAGGWISWEMRGVKRAQAALGSRLVNIPSRNILVEAAGLPEQIVADGVASPTNELVAVLQDLEMRHLPTEAKAVHRANHPKHVNPAMVIKGALTQLPEESSGFLQTAFDGAVLLSHQTELLDDHAGLAERELGRAALREETTEFLSSLAQLADAFLDDKSAEVVPLIKARESLATSKLTQQALGAAAIDAMTPGVRWERYKTLTARWNKPEKEDA